MITIARAVVEGEKVFLCQYVKKISGRDCHFEIMIPDDGTNFGKAYRFHKKAVRYILDHAPGHLLDHIYFNGPSPIKFGIYPPKKETYPEAFMQSKLVKEDTVWAVLLEYERAKGKKV